MNTSTKNDQIGRIDINLTDPIKWNLKKYELLEEGVETTPPNSMYI